MLWLPNPPFCQTRRGLLLYSIREISDIASAGGGRGQHDLSEVWTHGCAHFRYRGGWPSSWRCADIGRRGAIRPWAVDAGISFFDNAWEYCNGRTETILGRALRDGRRKKVFLMTKVCTHGRSGKLAMPMLEDSLRRYQTDHLDLWQIHGIVYDNDPELAYAKAASWKHLIEPEGKVRFVGFTWSQGSAFHLKMLELGYPFDSVQMPLNPFDANFHSFEKQVLPEVNRRAWRCWA